MKHFAVTGIAILLLAGAASGQFGMINVHEYGAIPDGRTDCTEAFQDALDKAGQSGLAVYVPAGQYRINGTLTLPDSASLVGTWEGPHMPLLDKGSTLLAYAGRGDEDSPAFIRLGNSCTLRGLTIYYPEQTVDNITPYPWTIQGYGSRYNIFDLTVVNAYNGIDCGTIGNEGHNLRNIQICALRRGVYIDRTTDIGRIENVHVHAVNWWRISHPKPQPAEFSDKINEFTLENLEGFIIGRCDWEYMTNCFVIWPKIGFHFVETLPAPDGTRHLTGQANIVITQSGSDIGPVAVKIDKTQDHAGIAFVNSQFMNGIEIGKRNSGPIKFSNCGFWGKTRTGAFLINEGPGTIMLDNCHFSIGATPPGYTWNPTVALIQNFDGSLLMQNCLFKEYGNKPKAHVLLDKNTLSAALIGNRVEGRILMVDNRTQADVQIIGNVREGK